jgi:hypothetical protein
MPDTPGPAAKFQINLLKTVKTSRKLPVSLKIDRIDFNSKKKNSLKEDTQGHFTQ